MASAMTKPGWWRAAGELYQKIRCAKLKIKSLTFLYAVLAISIIPILLYLGFWVLAAMAAAAGTTNPALLALLGELRQFVGMIFSASVVGAVVAYGQALVDNDEDGQSDLWQAKGKRASND